MQYFTWGINKPGTKEQRTSLIRTHWNFIEKYDKADFFRMLILMNDFLKIYYNIIEF